MVFPMDENRERLKSLLIALVLIAIAVFAYPLGMFARDMFDLPACCGAGMKAAKPPGLDSEREVF